MSLYVRDESVNRLAEQLRKALGVRTKTDAVRLALETMLRAEARKAPLGKRLKAIQQLTLAEGNVDADFDEKAYSDRMWGHE